MHKGYTINYFINLVQGTKNTKITPTTVATLVSPRLGTSSQAVSVLDSYLEGNLNGVLKGTRSFKTLGKTPRARLLNALKRRQTYGTLYV